MFSHWISCERLYTKKLVLTVCTFLEDENSIHEDSHKKTPNSSIKFSFASSISSTKPHILLKKWTELRMEDRVLLKSKRVAQSREQANMSLVLMQSCNSSQALYHFLPALLQQDNLVMLVVWILWSDEIRTSSKNHHNEWLHKIYILVNLA